MSKKITPHFTWSEMLYSYTDHINDEVDNIPGPYEKANLVQLCRYLELARKRFGKPLRINSGYRSKELNELIPGSSSSSYHLDGRAADIDISSYSSVDIDKLYTILDDLMPAEIYLKTNSYIHVAF